MNVRFVCPECDLANRPGSLALVRLGGEPPAGWRCPACDHLVTVSNPPRALSPEGVTLQACATCGNQELYKKKGFPHWLGLSILTMACLAFLVLNAFRLQWWAWAILLASAAIDGLLYLAVRDVVVCYRCGAQHSGLGTSGNRPFELTVHERYRQERMRLSAMSQRPSAEEPPAPQLGP